jgi:hypothetical protein
MESRSRTGGKFTHLKDTSSVIKSFNCSGPLVKGSNLDNQIGHPRLFRVTRSPDVKGLPDK